MTGSSPARAPDWIGQTWEERLRLCAETLFVRELIKPGTYRHAMDRLRGTCPANTDAANLHPVSRLAKCPPVSSPALSGDARPRQLV